MTKTGHPPPPSPENTPLTATALGLSEVAGGGRGPGIGIIQAEGIKISWWQGLKEFLIQFL